MFTAFTESYLDKFNNCFTNEIIKSIETLAEDLLLALKDRRKVFLFGNGGSAGNAIHLANDFLYGAGMKNGQGLNVEALTANPAVITCLANDIGYDDIFSEQLKVKGSKNDISIALSGSGNSKNILKGIETSNNAGMNTYAIVGFNGGVAKTLANTSIHFNVEDMQISEDLQLLVGHLCMKWLNK